MFLFFVFGMLCYNWMYLDFWGTQNVDFLLLIDLFLIL